jgi:GH15 family glucan-1,4-alpha-glucosidase
LSGSTDRNSSNSTTDTFDKKASLNLAVIGNCACSALIDKRGQIVWYCLPRFDGDPIFCSLLKNNVGLSSDIGFFDVTISQLKRTEQSYVGNSPVLRTRLYDENGGCLEIIDFIPRFQIFERDYRPNMLIRIVKPIANTPRTRAQIQLRPTFGYGWGSPEKTRGSNHIRYVLSNLTIRLTTNAPISYVVDEVMFEVEETLYFVLMPDESLRESLDELCISNLNKTLNYWSEWTKTLTIPFEWQDQVLRSAITLKLSQYEETGAFVA